MSTQVNSNLGQNITITPQFQGTAFAEQINENYARINALLNSFNAATTAQPAVTQDPDYFNFLKDVYTQGSHPVFSGEDTNVTISDLPSVGQMQQQIQLLTGLVTSLVQALQSFATATGAGSTSTPSTDTGTSGTDNNSGNTGETTNTGETDTSADTGTGETGSDPVPSNPLGNFASQEAKNLSESLSGQLQALNILGNSAKPEQIFEKKLLGIQLKILNQGASAQDADDIANGVGPLGILVNEEEMLNTFAVTDREVRGFTPPMEFWLEQAKITGIVKDKLANDLDLFEGRDAEKVLFEETLEARNDHFQTSMGTGIDARNGYSPEIYKANNILILLANGASVDQVNEAMSGPLGELSAAHAQTDTIMDMMLKQGKQVLTDMPELIQFWMQQSTTTSQMEQLLAANPDAFVGRDAEKALLADFAQERKDMYTELQPLLIQGADSDRARQLMDQVTYRNNMMMELVKGASTLDALAVPFELGQEQIDHLAELEAAYQEEFFTAKIRGFKGYSAMIDSKDVSLKGLGEDLKIGIRSDSSAEMIFRTEAEIDELLAAKDFTDNTSLDLQRIRFMIRTFVTTKDLNKDGLVDEADRALELVQINKDKTTLEKNGIAASEEKKYGLLNDRLDYIKEFDRQTNVIETQDRINEVVAKLQSFTSQIARMQSLNINQADKEAFINQINGQMAPLQAELETLRASF